jgi:hypothetical protein
MRSGWSEKPGHGYSPARTPVSAKTQPSESLLAAASPIADDVDRVRQVEVLGGVPMGAQVGAPQQVTTRAPAKRRDSTDPLYGSI